MLKMLKKRRNPKSRDLQLKEFQSLKQVKKLNPSPQTQLTREAEDKHHSLT